MIKFCPKCGPHTQDSIHGKGMRVFNPCKNGTAGRCTVCKHEITISSTEIKDNKLRKGDKK